MVGSRVYDNTVVARKCWPAVLDDDTYARVCLIFADRTRRHREPDRALLCGLVVCDACGKDMMATQRKADPKMVFDSARVVPLWWETIPIRPQRICERRIINSGRRLLTCGETASRLGQTERDVVRAVRQGRLEPAATEPNLRFRAATVDLFLDRCRVQPLARDSKPPTAPRS